MATELCVSVLFLLFLAGFSGATTMATELYVSVTGNDDNPGTKAEPLASLEAARDAARSLVGKGVVTVWIRGGLYERGACFELGKQDSGAEDAPVVYRAYEDESVRFSGGRRLPAEAFATVTNPAVLEQLDDSARGHVLQADLKSLGIDAFGDATEAGRKPELFFNRRPMILARWPNEGFAKVADVETAEPITIHGIKGDKVGRLIYEGNRPERWLAEADHMRLHGYWFWDWADSYERIESIDPERRLIATLPPYHGYGYRPGQRFYALNLLCELDSPGEWFLDRSTGMLYFWPPEPLDNASEVVVSMLEEPLVRMKDASHIVLRGLTFETTRGAAVEISGGTGVLVAACTIRNVGAGGVAIEGGNNHGVAGCEIHDTGTYGVSLQGGDRATLTPSGHFAVNNHIHHFARVKRTYSGAVQLRGVGCRVAHNDIHDAPHLAIIFGGNDHVMEFNVIHHVCEETGDVGCFYMGRDWTERGNVIRHNFIHDVSGPGLWGSSVVYLDDAASGTMVFGNIIYRCSRAMLLGGGRDNVVENNLIVDCDASITIDNRGMNWMADCVQEGGIMPERLKAVPYRQPPWSERYPKLVGILYDAPGVPKGNLLRRNVVVRTPPFGLADEVRQFGTVENNLLTDDDVGFADKAAMDFRLRDDSIIHEQVPGFQPIPFELIGLRIDEYRKELRPRRSE